MKKSIGAKDIAFPTPVFIVGTYDKEGRANAMNVAWGGICSSTPPCIAISLREQRYTYENILERKAFTINLPSEDYVKEADYFGMASGKKTDKFADTGLTAVKSITVDAPYIKEFPFNMECELVDSIRIGQHIHLIGEIKDIKVDEECLDNLDLPDIDKLRPLLFDPAAYSYNAVGRRVAKAFQVGNAFLKKGEEK